MLEIKGNEARVILNDRQIRGVANVAKGESDLPIACMIVWGASLSESEAQCLLEDAQAMCDTVEMPGSTKRSGLLGKRLR